MMKFESLPNELLLDLFVYFDGIDLLRAFSNLNMRFNLLLYKQFQSYSFQFRSISKRDFDMICQQHLPVIADRIITLQLSDDSTTPRLINTFFSYITSFKSFIHLQSLMICHLQSYPTMLQLLGECQRLSHLIRLHFYTCSFHDPSADSQSIFDKIWNLSKLIYCNIGVSINGKRIFSTPSIVSTSLKNVALFLHDLSWNQLKQLLEYTPNLKCFSTFIKSFPNQKHNTYVFPTLTRCRFDFYRLSNDLDADIYFPSMPNLRYLNIYIWNGLIYGHQWESIIRNYLPKLKIFSLRMEKTFLREVNLEDQANELFESFRTPFWLDEHQWFVRCFTSNQHIHLYTLVDGSNCYEHIFPNSYQSTYPNDNMIEVYNNMDCIFDETFFDKQIPSDIRLHNIRDLCIKLPINDQFWSVVSNFKQLKMLSISGYVDTSSSQLHKLLDRIPHLHELRIKQNASLPLQTSLFTYTNPSIRKLDLSSYLYYFNENQCLLLTRSSLAIQCEVLSIRIGNRRSIIKLVMHMTNLRSLTSQYADNTQQTKSLLGAILGERKIELVAWLKQRLSSTYLIVRDPDTYNTILIWK